MNNLVTVSAQSNAIANFVAKAKECVPFFYVMGLYLSGCAALLASVIVAFKYGLAPFAIAITSPIAVWVWSARTLVFALWRAIFLRVTPTVKTSAAPFAFQDFCGVCHKIAFIGAIYAGDICSSVDELHFTDWAYRKLANIAKRFVGFAGYKVFSTFVALKLIRLRFILFIKAVVTNLTGLSFTAADFADVLTSRATFGVIAPNKFSVASLASGCFHTPIIQYLERMATAFPGIEIERL